VAVRVLAETPQAARGYREQALRRREATSRVHDGGAANPLGGQHTRIRGKGRHGEWCSTDVSRTGSALTAAPAGVEMGTVPPAPGAASILEVVTPILLTSAAVVVACLALSGTRGSTLATCAYVRGALWAGKSDRRVTRAASRFPFHLSISEYLDLHLGTGAGA
jgi:hypothetical protein